MKSVITFVVVITASLALLVGGMDVAEAKRLGGGKSFGGKFSQSQSVNRTASQPQKAATPAQQTNSNLKESFAKKGGMMGMLGGLALGGLLGALFFGGAFDGINFMDVLLFGALGLAAFMIFRSMSSRARQQAQPATAGAYQSQVESEPVNTHQTRQSVEQHFGGSEQIEGPSLDSLRHAAPKGFDQDAFVDGAKNCFARLQKAWDEGDLADIRQFTTDHVFGEIQDQFQSRIGDSQTEILDLNAELLSANNTSPKQEAIVLFTAQLREDGNSIQVDEVWHFIKTSSNASWQLDGIQQVAG